MGATTLSITTLRISTLSIKHVQHNNKKIDMQHNDIQCLCSTVVIIKSNKLNVVMLNVVAPLNVVEDHLILVEPDAGGSSIDKLKLTGRSLG